MKCRGCRKEPDHANAYRHAVGNADVAVDPATKGGAAKSQFKCGGDNLQCGSLAKVCNLKSGKCCCMNVPQ
jgi:hypothetical protein